METEFPYGAKFRANNSLKNHHNKTAVQNKLTRIEKKTNEYLAAPERADRKEEGHTEPGGEAIRAALEILRERKAGFEELYGRVQADG